MMSVLHDIILHKKVEVSERKQRTSVKELENSMFFNRKTLSLKEALVNPEKLGIIAEHKRKSPSKGFINQEVTVEEVTQGYVSGGASALSVLTDSEFFDGSDEHVIRARKLNQVPILRKDFIIDEYQILEAKSIGADVVLLIAANLEPEQAKTLGEFAKSLGLEILLEVHNQEELETHLNQFVDVVGVNNRNLKTMKTDLNTSKELSSLIPSQFLKISESGISDPEVLLDLKNNYHYNGFLIGEYFMLKKDPGKALEAFVQNVLSLSASYN